MDTMLSRETIAERLGLSIATVDRLRQDPTFPRAARLGRSLRWREQDVAAWVEQRTAPTAPTRGRRSSAEELMTS